MSLVGTTLGIYRVEAELGRGGMGTVYRAVAAADGPAGPAGTAVALKVFHAPQAEDERAFSRVRLEAEIGKEIHHPHLVRTYGIASAEADGATRHFTVMELIEGRTLKDLLAELGSFPESLLFEVADQVLDALAAIHARGVVHRDVKPENVVITPDHRVLLMDLGVARRVDHREAARGGQFVGSLAYAPPEQFQGVDVGPRADLYALGISLYELATGTNPYAGLEMGAVMAAKLDREPAAPRTVQPDLGAFWDEVIRTCIRQRPTERFASATELRGVLAEGEGGAWWRLQRAGRGAPSAQRALERLRLERRAPLVGRERAAARLAACQDEARRAGRVVLLTGVSGAGKSRLLYEHLEAVAGASGPLLAAGRATSEGGRGFAPFVDALGDLLGAAREEGAARDEALANRLGGLLPEASGVVAPLAAFVAGVLQPGQESGLSKDALHAAVADLLRALAAERTLVVAIDDLQHADQGTVELFAYLARSLRAAPVLLVGVLAPDEVAEGSACAALLAMAETDDDVERLALENLDAAAVEALTRAVVRSEPTVRAVAPVLYRRSAGNPLLALELLAHLADRGVLAEREGALVLAGEIDEVSVPANVRDLVKLRLGSVDEDGRELLEAAAVLGPSFEVSTLGAVLEEEPIELLQRLAVLERRHRLLQSAGKEAFRFAGPAVYAAIYEDIPPSLREEYHALIADTLLEADDETPTGRRAWTLLRHLALAERAAEAAPFLAAALAYMGTSVPADEGAPFLERLAAAFEDAGPQARLAVAMRLWSFCEMRGDRKAEMRVLEAAEEHAEALGQPGPRARVHALRAGTLWYAGDYEGAGEQAERGLACAREAGSRAWEATCLHTLGVVAYRRGRTQVCVERWREALAIRREIEDRRGVASTLQALALVMRAIGEEDKVLPTMQEALAHWRAIGERRGEASMLGNIGNHFVDSACYEEGLGYLERALAMHRETGALMNAAIVSTNMGHALNFLGRIDEARAAWERALGIFVDHGNPNGELAVRTMLGGALAEHGEDDEARAHLEAAVTLAERTGNQAKLALAHRALGQLHHDGGAREEGWRHLEAALAVERELGDATGRVLSLALCGRAALAEGDTDRALAVLTEALDDARDIASLAPLVLARLARALQGAGREAEAREHAREVLARLDEGEQVSTRDGPEVYFALHQVLGEERLLARARELLEQRAAAVRNDTYREHLLTRAWPATEIRRAGEASA